MCGLGVLNGTGARRSVEAPARMRTECGQSYGPRCSCVAALTKGGLAAVTVSLATECASRSVRVNAVALGVIKTSMRDPTSYEGMAGLHPLARVSEISHP
jgi:NAD(P)-dependent dehydrogenase (short-subunit alcohol dehydrogenase family)